jgi:hypothetical protein
LKLVTQVLSGWIVLGCLALDLSRINKQWTVSDPCLQPVQVCNSSSIALTQSTLQTEAWKSVLFCIDEQRLWLQEEDERTVNTTTDS